MPKTHLSFPSLAVEALIHEIRDQKVILDSDLANLYGVPTKVLNQAVRRNPERFPQDFMFQLTRRENESLRSQIVTSKGRGGRRYPPLVFTQEGVAMLSSVLNSPRAIIVNVAIMRAFVRLRLQLVTQKAIGQRLVELERFVSTHDRAIRSIFETIRQLMTPPAPKKKRQIGFRTESDKDEP